MRRTRRTGLGWPARLLLVVIGLAAGGAAVWLSLPEVWLVGLLGRFYPPERYDLSDPVLLANWRLLLAALAGAGLCLLLGLTLTCLRRWRRPRPAPTPLAQLQAALAAGDRATIEQVCATLEQRAGHEPIPALGELLRAQTDDSLRRRLAATLYKLGRAVTAEVSVGRRG